MFGIATASLVVLFTPSSFSDNYGFHTPTFHQVVADSYKPSGRSSKLFFDWMDKECKRLYGMKANAWIANRKRQISKAKAKGKLYTQELAVSRDAFSFVKKSITHFSLDRGFEFCNVTDKGERQCLLQSFLIAAILQDEGLNAGCAMVWSNEHGQTSNLGHVTALLRLADGHDLMVDASHTEPSIAHQGIFVYNSSGKTYAFVHPRFDKNSNEIVGYEYLGQRDLPIKDVKALDLAYLRSQFDFYRGERVPRGFLAKNADRKALEATATYFEHSLMENPKNPLTTYLLGTVYRRLGRETDAKRLCQAALKMYDEYGWVPESVLKAAMK